MKPRQAFTLIELLIVVAIIAILAAIAVPNFLQAQTRSKVARLKADMRTADTGLKSYFVDNNRYTWDRNYDATAGINRLGGWFFNHQYLLTTPIAYLATVQLPDPFYTVETQVELGQIASSWKYFNYGYDASGPGRNWGDAVAAANPSLTVVPVAGYAMTSYGPDREYQGGEWAGMGYEFTLGSWQGINRLYDPTNGTVSLGDIVRIERPGLTIN